MSPTWRRRRAGRSPARTIGLTRSKPCLSWAAGSRAAWAPTRPSPSDRGAADRFASENGGRVLAFAEVPRDYVLGAGIDTTSSVEETPTTLSAGHGSPHAGSTAGHAH